MKNFVLVLVLAFSSTGWTLDLEEYLKVVLQKNSQLKALELSKQASRNKRLAADIGYSPLLTLSGSYLSDKKQPSFIGNTETIATKYSLGLSKKFKTGTSIKVFSDLSETQNKDIPTPTYAALLGQYSSGDLGVSITQSLNKDRFGQASFLKSEQDDLIVRLEEQVIDLQIKQYMLEAELAYWDYLYLLNEKKLREASLERAEKIEKWVSRRSFDGIADKSDLMNAKALSATRNLQLIMSKDELNAVSKRLKDFLELDDSDPLPELVGQIERKRGLPLLDQKATQILRRDAYIAWLESRLSAKAVEAVEEDLKSDLSLAASYNTNSYQSQGKIGDATNGITNTSTPTTSVSLVWTYMFDNEAKKSAGQRARQESLASEAKSKKKRTDSLSAQEELVRRYQEMSLKVDTAEQISNFQKERAKVEQDKYSKGRSITSQVIMSEQDAAEAELTLIKLKVEQRKMEAQTHLFLNVEENL